jgi:hypothetical protein
MRQHKAGRHGKAARISKDSGAGNPEPKLQTRPRVIAWTGLLVVVLVGGISHIRGPATAVVVGIIVGWTAVGWATAFRHMSRTARSARPRAARGRRNEAPPMPSWWQRAGWAGPPGPPPRRPGCPPPLLFQDLTPASVGLARPDDSADREPRHSMVRLQP